MISEKEIDSDLLESDEPVLLVRGGSRSSGYKRSKFYNLELYYIPSADQFVISKSSIMGGPQFSHDTLEEAVSHYNDLCEDSYENKAIVDRYDVSDYIVEEVEE